MTLQKADKKLTALHAWLRGRGWDSYTPLERAKHQVEHTTRLAIEDEIIYLNRLEEEAKNCADNNVYTLVGVHIPMSKRDQQRSMTELKRIRKVKQELKDLLACST